MNIGGSTKLIGLFGNPVEHSMSPTMHNQAFKQLGLDYRYLAFNIEESNLKEAVNSIRALNIAGVNVTIPYKEKVIKYLDSLSKEAEVIGAVNTIVNQDGELIGHNTDGQGFIRSLREKLNFNPDSKQALIIGAGGAARAVAVQLVLEGVERIYLHDLDSQRAKNLATEIKENLTAEIVVVEAIDKDLIANIKLLVDATPVGMYPNDDVEAVIGAEMLVSDLTVVDLVYNPIETVLLKEAKKVGAQTLSGLSMLVYQGAIAFELWTGEHAPANLMEEVIKTELTK